MKTSVLPSTKRIGVGVDTARYGHHCTFLREDRQPAADPLAVAESQDGYRKLGAQLKKLHRQHHDAHFHVHIDAAGQYATNLERFVRRLKLPMTISIGEPKRNKDYHKAISPKRKADTTESHAMARFGVIEQPPETLGISDEIYLLREVASRLQGQVKDVTRAINRLHNLLARVFPELATIVSSLSAAWVLALLRKYPTPQRMAKAHMTSLVKIPYLTEKKATKIRAAAKQTVGTVEGALAESLVRELVKDLQNRLNAQEKMKKLLLQAYKALPRSGHVHLESILGIGSATAAVLVAKIVSIDRFATPENLVGYFGIFPEENSSGVDRFGKPALPGTEQMSQKGSDLVRRYLWLAAQSAIQCNPAVRALYARLRAKGKRGDVALGHCMRKLLHLVFAVWSSDTPFSEDHYPWERHNSALAENQDPQNETATKKAAGHKREVFPQNKVVTAATFSVKDTSPAVNEADDEPPHDAAGSVDYAFLRQQITMRQILDHLGHLERLRGHGPERRGPCPLHGPEKERSRSLSVNLDKNVFQCFHPECAQVGNVLDYWAAVHRLPLHQAALNMAKTFHLQTRPEQRRGARKMKPKPR